LFERKSGGSVTQAIERINDYSLASLERRIRLNREAGWGLQGATSSQLNMLALYCEKHRLLPGDDVTLYGGSIWITVDGRVKLLRRNHRDEYRGFSQRPLSKDEKAEWGWAAKDVVIETTIRTVTYGDIKGYGRVSAAEAEGVKVDGVRHNPVAHHQPVEMAMKRSLARAERFAFGTESLIDDDELEDTARTVIEERNDPERVQRNSDRYRDIFEEDEARATTPSRRAASAPAAPNSPAESPVSDIQDETEDEATRRQEWEAEEVKRQRAQEGLL